MGDPGNVLLNSRNCFTNYHTYAIIRRGLYIVYPIFNDHFFVFMEVLSENSVQPLKMPQGLSLKNLAQF